jgi:hypothetical protein
MVVSEDSVEPLVPLASARETKMSSVAKTFHSRGLRYIIRRRGEPMRAGGKYRANFQSRSPLGAIHWLLVGNAILVMLPAELPARMVISDYPPTTQTPTI